MATDYVFQAPRFIISSTAVPARDLLREPPTRMECIVKRLGSPAARKWPCKSSYGLRRLPRPPSAVTTGKRCPAVKSHHIRCVAEMYAVTAWNAHIFFQTPFILNEPVATTLSYLRPRFTHVLGHYGYARSQGQPAAAKPPLCGIRISVRQFVLTITHF